MAIITTNLQQAIRDLEQGKPVAIPTETVYGLAALVSHEAGIRAVFSMKKRPLNHPLIVHVARDQDLSPWVESIPDYAKTLMQAFWPGPLTLVFKAKDKAFNPMINGGQSTVAIRSPDHPLTQELLSKLDAPLVAPSANPFGKVSPTTAAHVLQSFPNQPLTVLNGGRCRVGIESTIIDATRDEGYLILRHGSVSEQALTAVAPNLLPPVESFVRVPGKLATHYQPEKQMYYFEDLEKLTDFCQRHPKEVTVIARQRPASVAEAYFLAFPDEPAKAAYELYFQLRAADMSDANWIVIELPPSGDEWAGVNERILKAGKPCPSEENH